MQIILCFFMSTKRRDFQLLDIGYLSAVPQMPPKTFDTWRQEHHTQKERSERRITGMKSLQMLIGLVGACTCQQYRIMK